MDNNFYSSKNNHKVYITYFDALYLLNIVFKENKEYSFIDSSHVESIWNTIDLNIINSALLKHSNTNLVDMKYK
jgi:hypothetical protein